MAQTCSDALVTLNGGMTVRWAVVAKPLDLEARGATFELVEGGGFAVAPRSVLTDDDRAFLRVHRDDARRCLEYVESITGQSSAATTG